MKRKTRIYGQGKIAATVFVSLFLLFAKSHSALAAAGFTPPAARDTSYQAAFAGQSIDDPITIEAGQTKEVDITFKNSGKTTWYSTGKNFISAYTVDPGYRKSAFAGGVWMAKDQPVKINGTVKPGKTGMIKIKLYAPQAAGQYTERFNLAAENKTWIKGGYFFLKINVVPKQPVAAAGATIAGATSTIQAAAAALGNGQEAATTTSDVTTDAAFGTSTAPAGASISDNPAPAPRILINQPNIRVGLYKTDQPVAIETDYPYEVYSGTTHQGTIFSGGTATLSYSDGTYYFKNENFSFSSADKIRLVPDDMSYHFAITNYSRTISGRDANFNAYRGVLEYSYSPKSDMPYVIEELPLDEYVAGIAETSNDSASEYIKAVLVAARTYGYTHLDPSGKNMFDVYPNTTDQLYLGYNSETLMPRVAAAGQSTYGQMVTYGGNPVTTYYFGHSDGRTRSWTEVWGGYDHPWLQSVEAQYDVGLDLWGHGIGMSTHDASLRAAKDGWTYDQILRYYYTGVQIEKIY